ncbi:MAG: FliH/SctL family protein [Lachnospiraceae bacterium]|nr:FliH/SctL family protein [Lachnospiraceae bacterium]MDD3659380.1 FliH/SctL family protein [Lachnospiraceae bacterium]
MSSNLFKSGYVVLHGDEKRIIDSNEQMEIKISHLREIMKNEIKDAESENRFAEGLDAYAVEALLDDSDHTEQMAGMPFSNVIKAEPVYSGPSAEEIAEEARLKADSMLADAAREAETIRQNAYQEGYQKGLDAGQQEANQILKEEEVKLQELKKQLEKEYQKQVSELEPVFIDTLTDIYEHIFKTDLSRFRSVILFSLQNIIAGSEANRDFIIHTASEDYLYLVEKRELIMEMVSGSSTVEIIKDLTLSQGQCMVETGGGIFDCSIDTQLDGLAKELRLLSFDKKK